MRPLVFSRESEDDQEQLRQKEERSLKTDYVLSWCSLGVSKRKNHTISMRPLVFSRGSEDDQEQLLHCSNRYEGGQEKLLHKEVRRLET